MAVWKAAKKTDKTPTIEELMAAGEPLLTATAQKLGEAVAEGFALSETKVSAAFKKRLKADVWLFSTAKTYEQLKEISDFLFQDEKLRPWSAFKNDVVELHPKYNVLYLESEYQHAVASSQMGAKWQKFEAEKDLFQLKYVATIDERTRASHKGLHGTTLPVDDPFWDSFLPPNGWRCRCLVLQVSIDLPASDSEAARKEGEKATTQIGANGENKLEIFRFNPGKEKVVFPKNHPYYEVSKAENTTIRKFLPK